MTLWHPSTVEPSVFTIVVFAVAVAVLAAFDISLPRGDVVGVSSALDVVTFALFGPAVSLTVAAIGLAIAYSFREGREAATAALWALFGRCVGVASATVAVLAIRLLSSSNGGERWGVVGCATVAYFVAETFTAQATASVRTGRNISGLLRGNFRRQLPVILAEISAAMLAVVVYPSMREWSLLLVVALLLLIRQSYALLLGIAETYRTTVEVLVSAAEGVEGPRSGHAERVAHLARAIASGCRLSAREVERISYAALLHDLGSLSSSSTSGGVRMPASAVLQGVRFFDGVVDVLRICEDVSTDRPGGRPESDQVAAFIVALASDIDAVSHPEAHDTGQGAMLPRLATAVDKTIKAKVVAAALRQGYRIPAVS